MKNKNIRIWTLLGLALLLTLPISAQKLSEDESRNFDYFFTEACRLKMKGDYQQSAKMFQNCLQIDKNSAIAHFEFGKLLLMSGDEANALKFLKQTVLLNPKNDWYQVYLTNVYIHSKKYHQAIEVFKNLHKTNPDKIDYQYQLAELYTQTQQFAKAIEIYDEIEAQEGMDEALILEKHRLYMLAGDSKGAYNEIKRLLSKYPDQSKYLIVLGDYYTSIGNFKKAKKTFDKAYDIEPDNGNLHLSYASYYEQTGQEAESQAELKLAFASEVIAYEQKMQILLSYMMLAEKDSSVVEPIEDLVVILKDTYPEEASTYYFYANFVITDTAKLDLVVENLHTAVDLDASNVDAWMQLIQVAFSKQDFVMIMDYADQAIDAGVSTPQLFFYQGIAAQQNKEHDKAKEAFSNAIAITEDNNPLKTQLLGSMGDVSYELKEEKAAFDYYEQALALDPHNIMVLNNYAYYLSEKDTLLAKAETMSAKCIELEPGNPTYLDTYAWILYLRDNILLAKFYMEKAIHNIGEDNDVLYDHYADILYRNGDTEEAIQYWQKAIDCGGNEASLKEKMMQ